MYALLILVTYKKKKKQYTKYYSIGILIEYLIVIIF